MSKLKIKRIYEPAEPADGFRVLVDRLWPRGVSKEKAQLDLWCKEVAPSTQLRQWFGHDPVKWNEFAKRYRDELKNNPALPELKKAVKQHANVTLLYGARDQEHNEAAVLQELLD